MNKLTCRFIGIAILFMTANSSGVANDKTDKSLRDNQAAQKLQPVIYVPPMRGAPRARIGAGTRGTGMEDLGRELSLRVLAPEHTGWTMQAQPNLYWYVSRPVNAHFEFSIIEEQRLETIVESRLDQVAKAGIQKISLQEYAVRLQPNTSYQWVVALVFDVDRRSADVIASGTIATGEELQSSLEASAINEKDAVEQAARGHWYDALDILSLLIEQRPGDTGLRVQRSALLNQVNLPEVAMHDPIVRGLSRR